MQARDSTGPPLNQLLVERPIRVTRRREAISALFGDSLLLSPCPGPFLLLLLLLLLQSLAKGEGAGWLLERLANFHHFVPQFCQ